MALENFDAEVMTTIWISVEILNQWGSWINDRRCWLYQSHREQIERSYEWFKDVQLITHMDPLVRVRMNCALTESVHQFHWVEFDRTLTQRARIYRVLPDPNPQPVLVIATWAVGWTATDRRRSNEGGFVIHTTPDCCNMSRPYPLLVHAAYQRNAKWCRNCRSYTGTILRMM